MRTFEDDQGRLWVGSVRLRPGRDYKGRYYFFLVLQDGPEAEGVALVDVRWNSERAAERSLETMSDVELRRRLRSATGRGRPAAHV